MIKQDLLLQIADEQVGFALNEQEQSGKWKAYAQYNDAGVEWLEKIPSHWEIKRLKFSCTVNPSKAEIHRLPKDTVVSFLPMELIGEDGQLSLTQQREIHQLQQGYSYFRSGDVIVAKITPCFENGKGALCEQLVNTIGFGTTELHTIRPAKHLNALFLFYTTRSTPFRHLGAAHMIGSAGQQRVPEEFIKNFPLLQPPLQEQHTIVVTIKRELARIDTLIAKKEQHIALLQERRTVIINQAVTKGLNADVQMKASAVEWLGEIVEHWEVRRLKYLVEAGLVNGIFKKKDCYGSGTKLVNVVDIYQNNHMVDVNQLELVEASKTEVRIYQVNAGDIFFVRSSLKLAGVGASACVKSVREPIIFECHLVRIRPIVSKINPLFLIHYLNAFVSRHRLVALAKTTTMTTIAQDELSTLEVALPPLSEQDTIIAYLEQETTKIDKLITGIQESIKKLKEYSTALISAAVTGQIDVRGEVTARSVEAVII